MSKEEKIDVDEVHVEDVLLDENTTLVKKEDLAPSVMEDMQNAAKEFEAFRLLWAAESAKKSKVKTAHKKQKRKIGKKKVQDPNGGYKWVDNWEDYLEENYMRDLLNRHFPGSSVEFKGFYPVTVYLGKNNNEKRLMIISAVELVILDDFLWYYTTEVLKIPKDRAPFTKRWPGLGGGLYQVSNETGNLIHQSNPAKTSITEAVKYAINRGTRLGDDTYQKEEASAISADQFADALKLIYESNLPIDRIKAARDYLISEVDQAIYPIFIKKLKQEIEENGKAKDN